MDTFSKIISAGVGPIIVISACGLLCLAFYNRLAAIVTRLRTFQREQLLEQEAMMLARKAGDEAASVRRQEVLGMLRVQIDHIIKRGKLIRQTLFCLLLTILLLAMCSLSLGLGIVYPRLVYGAAVFFVLGLLTLMLGVLFAIVELRLALDPVHIADRFILQLSNDLADVD